MENSERSELSCMTYLPNCGMVATGHEDGHIKLWNMEIGHARIVTDQTWPHGSETISCIQAIEYKKAEYIICGSFDGTVSIWEVSLKSHAGQGSSIKASVYPILRGEIKNEVPHKSDILGNEIHAIIFFDEDKIIIGGNPITINVWTMSNYE